MTKTIFEHVYVETNSLSRKYYQVGSAIIFSEIFLPAAIAANPGEVVKIVHEMSVISSNTLARVRNLRTYYHNLAGSAQCSQEIEKTSPGKIHFMDHIRADDRGYDSHGRWGRRQNSLRNHRMGRMHEKIERLVNPNNPDADNYAKPDLPERELCFVPKTRTLIFRKCEDPQYPDRRRKKTKDAPKSPRRKRDRNPGRTLHHDYSMRNF